MLDGAGQACLELLFALRGKDHRRRCLQGGGGTRSAIANHAMAFGAGQSEPLASSAPRSCRLRSVTGPRHRFRPSLCDTQTCRHNSDNASRASPAQGSRATKTPPRSPIGRRAGVPSSWLDPGDPIWKRGRGGIKPQPRAGQPCLRQRGLSYRRRHWLSVRLNPSLLISLAIRDQWEPWASISWRKASSSAWERNVHCRPWASCSPAAGRVPIHTADQWPLAFSTASTLR